MVMYHFETHKKSFASFSFPNKTVMLWEPIMDVLCLTDILTLTVRTYVLSPNHILKTNKVLSKDILQ